MNGLRPYQIEAIDSLRKSIAAGNRRIIVAMATGAGKTRMTRKIIDMAREKKNGVLYTAHRRILVDQAKAEFDGLENVTVETLQSAKKHAGDFKLIIFDEAHYASGSSLQNTITASFPNAIIIGLSATPITAEGYRLDGWDDVIDVVQLRDLIEGGYACKVRVLSPTGIERDFKVTAGDYNKKQVDAAVRKSAIVKDVVAQYQKYGQNRRAVVYCVTIEHAEMLTDEFNAAGIECGAVHSQSAVRDTTLQMFKNGELQVVCNVDVLTTGLDMPDIYCLILATPTKSIVKAVQIYGRGTRLNPADPEKDCLILDCANVIEDTVHPMQRLEFDKPKPDGKKAKRCECGGKMLLVKRTASDIDEYGIYTLTEKRKCDSCGIVKVENGERTKAITFCDGCGEAIESGTAKNTMEIDDDSMRFESECPHCGHTTVRREVLYTDAELKATSAEINPDRITDGATLYEELKKARRRDGSKVHHRWAKRVCESVRDIEGLREAIRYALSKGWSVTSAVQRHIGGGHAAA